MTGGVDCGQGQGDNANMIEQLRLHSVRSLHANAPAITNVDAAVRTAFQAVPEVLASIPKDAPVAVTCGSRGIDCIAAVVRAACAVLREAGARPFVVPAMGSHGGATAEGQHRLLADLGVNEELVGVPVVSSMEAVSLGRTPEGFETFMDRAAWESGRVLVLNRVKLHTDFEGEVESGLLKMMTVGLGKLEGASSLHTNSLRNGFPQVILSMSRHTLASGRILAGLGLLENDRHRLCEVAAAPAADPAANIERLERRLLARARQLHPTLPFSLLDLLIVDEIGKNISGVGMDTKVIGRSVHPDRMPLEAERSIRIRRIYIRDLTPESEGNASGMGLADAMHERIARKADLHASYTNARTALSYVTVRMPIRFASDRAALDFLLGNLGSPAPETVRAAWIRNTLSVATLLATPPCAAELAGNSNYEVQPAVPLEFDEAGELKTAAPALAEATL